MRVLQMMLLAAMAFPALATSLVLNLNQLPAYQSGGVYVGLLTAEAEGRQFNIVCNDYSSTTYIPNRVQVDVSPLSVPLPTRFGGMQDALLTYERAAILLTQMKSAMNNASETASYQWAIWRLFKPSLTINDPVLLAAVEVKLTQSANEVRQPHDYSQIRIYTPGVAGVDGYNHDGRFGQNNLNQEFMSGSVVATPEPATLILVGIALLVLAAKLRRFT